MHIIFLLLFLILILILIISININIKHKKLILENFHYRPNNKINIIQTWKNEQIPQKYIPLVNKIKKLENINYLFFTDIDINNFILNTCPQYKQIFDNFKYTIQKIDFFRYLAVYYLGGIYLDLDFYLQSNFDDLNIHKCVLPIEYQKSSDKVLHQQNFLPLIGNYAFYAPKKHQFLKLLIDNIIKQRLSLDYLDERKYVYYSTGPVMMTQSYIDFQNKNSIELIQPNPFKNSHFGNYGYHINMGSWKK